MAITKMTADVNLVSKLGTRPKVDNGLTTDALKAWFDKAPGAIKTYLNEVLIPEIEAKFGTLDEWAEEANRKMDNFVAGVGFLPSTGGDMSGPLDMQGNKISNVASPTNGTDAATKEYTDDAVSQGCADALKEAKEYADQKHIAQTATLKASAWVNQYQTISVSSVTADTAKTNVIVSADPGDADAYEAYLSCKVRACQQKDGALVFYCESTPGQDLTVNISVEKVGG